MNSLRLIRACLVGAVCMLSVTSPHAQVLRQLTDFKVDETKAWAVDDAASTVVAISSTNAFGGNPTHAFQIVKWSYPGGVGSQVTSLSRGVGSGPLSITDDGSTIAFISQSDPLGTNHDAGRELFLIDSDGSALVQLTSDPSPLSGSVYEAIISGSGNRVVFTADTDPLGTNGDGSRELFVIDADGSNLAQLSGAPVAVGLSVSDDGQRIAFSSSDDLWTIEADGSNLTQVTNYGGSTYARYPMIAGNGAAIVFQQGGDVAKVDWGSSVVTVLGSGRTPSIDDNAKWVYFAEEDADPNREVWVVSASGGAATQLTFTGASITHAAPLVSGGNGRVVFEISGGAPAGITNPDGEEELLVMDASGANIEQLTLNDRMAIDYEPDVTPDGAWVVFQGSNPLGAGEVFRMRADGSELTAVTSGAEARHPTVTADGNTIAFLSSVDLTGENPCSGGFADEQVFTIQADGSGLTQRTPANCFLNRFPVISRDGSMVVLNRDAELFAISMSDGTLTQLTNDGLAPRKRPRLSDDGLWVAYQSYTNMDGMNTGGGYQIFRARTDGSLVERITGDPTDQAADPDISADGSRIVYDSTGDPLGTNADRNLEIFLYDASTTTTQQLTFTTDGHAFEPIISSDGAFVYFWSYSSFFEPDNPTDLYRVTVANGLIERANGLSITRGGISTCLCDRPRLTVDGAGRAIFTGPYDSSGGTNLDFNYQLWLVDFAGSGRVEPGVASPTVVAWEAEPGPIRYDAIRGDVSDLAPGGGGTVDLGTVVCLEDDSPDNTTEGFGDAVQPTAGQVFFYVHRGSQGMLDGPGSWGQGSAGGERLPTAGSCADIP